MGLTTVGLRGASALRCPKSCTTDRRSSSLFKGVGGWLGDSRSEMRRGCSETEGHSDSSREVFVWKRGRYGLNFLTHLVRQLVEQ